MLRNSYGVRPERHEFLIKNDAITVDLVLQALRYLERIDLDLVFLVEFVLWGSPGCVSNAQIRTARSRFTHYSGLPQILSNLWKPPKKKGRRADAATDTMGDWAMQCTKTMLQGEMTKVAKHMKPRLDQELDESLLEINFKEIMVSVKQDAPRLWEVLRSIAWTWQQEKRNTQKSPDWVILQMISMASYSSSHHHNLVAKLNTVALRAAGTPTRVFDALHQWGFSMSYSWSCNCCRQLATRELQSAREACHPDAENGGAALVYDNMNVAQLSFEQRVLRPKKMLNATVLAVRVLPLEAKTLRNRASLEEGRRRGDTTQFARIALVDNTSQSRVYASSKHHVLAILLECAAFSKYEFRDSPVLAPPPSVYQLQGGEKAIHRSYILAAVEIDESTYEGNAKILELYWKLLQWSKREHRHWLAEDAVTPLTGDGLTYLRDMGLAKIRALGVNGIDRLDSVLLSFGWLHCGFAFVESLHKQYLGTAAGSGLAHAAAVLKRKDILHPNKRGPWFRHLEETVLHALEAHILDGFEVESGVSLKELVKQRPEELVALADRVHQRFASTQATSDLRRDGENTDQVLLAAVMFTRDALTFREFTTAIKVGDVGRLRDLIPTLLARMEGGGNSQYVIMLLELFQSLEVEWNEDIRKLVMEYNWLITTDGKDWLPVDEDQEHKIKAVKDINKNHGPSDPMKFLGKIAGAIPALTKVYKHYQQVVDGAARGSSHGTPSKDDDIELLRQAYSRAKIHVKDKGREAQQEEDIPKDVEQEGWKGLLSGNTIDRWWSKRIASRARSQEQTFVDGIGAGESSDIEMADGCSTSGDEDGSD